MAFQKPPTVSDDERAQDIYRRAAEVIHSKGFDATSMGDIADAVDLTKGGLYYYIKGKKALLFAIMSFAMDLVELKVMDTAREIPDPGRRLAALIAGYVHLVLEEPHAMTILVYEDEGLDAEHRPRIEERKDAYRKLLQASVSAVLEHHPGTQTIDATVAAYSILGMAHWAARWYEPGGPLHLSQVVEQITQMALHGLVPRR